MHVLLIFFFLVGTLQNEAVFWYSSVILLYETELKLIVWRKKLEDIQLIVQSLVWFTICIFEEKKRVISKNKNETESNMLEIQPILTNHNIQKDKVLITQIYLHLECLNGLLKKRRMFKRLPLPCKPCPFSGSTGSNAAIIVTAARVCGSGWLLKQDADLLFSPFRFPVFGLSISHVSKLN